MFSIHLCIHLHRTARLRSATFSIHLRIFLVHLRGDLIRTFSVLLVSKGTVNTITKEVFIVSLLYGLSCEGTSIIRKVILFRNA